MLFIELTGRHYIGSTWINILWLIRWHHTENAQKETKKKEEKGSKKNKIYSFLYCTAFYHQMLTYIFRIRIIQVPEVKRDDVH